MLGEGFPARAQRGGSMLQATTPVVTVIVVSDYAAGEDTGWDDIRSTLTALAHQDFREPAEFILVESAAFKDRLPRGLDRLLPGLQVIFSPGETASELYNHGVQAASSDIVALLDADCTPDPGWLRSLVRFLREHPDFAVVSGRTTYPLRSLLMRVLSLLDRAYVEQNRGVRTRSISKNNSGWRRSALLAHPLQDVAGPFASRLHAEELMRNGHSLGFEPRMRVVHAYEGWAAERAARRGQGYGIIRTRQLDRAAPGAWMARLGYLSIPVLMAYRTLDSMKGCLRLGPSYGVRWYHVPLAFPVALMLHAFEIPGMLEAIRGRALSAGRFR
jgi:glycosyltransferase involved in cell wall biosynthesis